MSSASLLADARQALEGYLAGRLKAERVVVVVAEAYYMGSGGGSREQLRPILEVIERAAPGIVALGRIDGGAGFDIRLAERPFPRGYETALKEAAQAVLAETARESAPAQTAMVGDTRSTGTEQREAGEPPGLIARIVKAVRRLFSASA